MQDLAILCSVVTGLCALLESFHATKILSRVADVAARAGKKRADERFFVVIGIASFLVGVLPRGEEFRALLAVLLQLPRGLGEWFRATLYGGAASPLAAAARALLFERVMPFLRSVKSSAVLTWLPSTIVELWKATRSGLLPEDLAQYETHLAESLLRIGAEQRSRRSEELRKFASQMHASATSLSSSGSSSSSSSSSKARNGAEVGAHRRSKAVRATMGTSDFRHLLRKGL
jgi:hypothetical protein